MSEIKLLPCPFCGGEAILSKNALFTCSSFVKCKKCGARTMEHTSESMANAKLNAVNSWNTRKPMQEIVERLEEEQKNNIDWITIESLYYDGKVAGLEDAIEICKEVGGMNE